MTSLIRDRDINERDQEKKHKNKKKLNLSKIMHYLKFVHNYRAKVY